MRRPPHRPGCPEYPSVQRACLASQGLNNGVSLVLILSHLSLSHRSLSQSKAFALHPIDTRAHRFQSLFLIPSFASDAIVCSNSSPPVEGSRAPCLPVNLRCLLPQKRHLCPCHTVPSHPALPLSDRPSLFSPLDGPSSGLIFHLTSTSGLLLGPSPFPWVPSRHCYSIPRVTVPKHCFNPVTFCSELLSSRFITEFKSLSTTQGPFESSAFTNLHSCLAPAFPSL